MSKAVQYGIIDAFLIYLSLFSELPYFVSVSVVLENRGDDSWLAQAQKGYGGFALRGFQGQSFWCGVMRAKLSPRLKTL